MTAEPIRLGDLSLGPDSDGDDAARPSSGSDPEEFDMDEEARADAGRRAMSAIRDNDTTRFVNAMRDLMPFLKD